jgi:soluble lytic murein transglycosylase-like protein
VTSIWSICLLLVAALAGASDLGPPQLIFDQKSSPSIISPTAPANVVPPKYPSLHSRRSEAYDRAVLFIREERFSEALALIRKQPKEIREWSAMEVLEAGLISVTDPKRSLDIYYKIINQKVRDRHWTRALAGYRLILEKMSSAGDYGAKAKLIRILGLQWRNHEAMAILEETLSRPDLPTEIKTELLSFRAVLALRVGDFKTAGEFWQNRKDQSSLRWLSTLRLREGKFTAAAEARLSVANSLKGNNKLKELDRTLDIMVKGGLSLLAEELLVKNPELKKRLPDWNYRLGLAYLIDGKPDKAIGYFEAEIQRKDGQKKDGQKKDSQQKASLYFKARALEMLKRNDEALTLYRQCAAAPMNYYRLLAEGRIATLSKLTVKLPLAEPMAALLSDRLEDRDTMGFFLWLSERLHYPWPDLSAVEAPRQSGSSNLERSKFAVAHYLSTGNLYAAYGELAAAGEAVIPGKTLEGDTLGSVYVYLAALAGDYRLAVDLMNRMKAPQAFTGNRWNHPLVYGRPILKAWRKHGLSPQLVLSVIRTESAFQSEVVSSSNARGLMQILPSTAMKIALLEGDLNFREDDLFDRQLNIRYGTAYLSLLISSFGHQALALAAYNGGPFNITTYLEAVPDRPLDLFIETLPFAESSNYVKMITESQAKYEAAYLGQYSLSDFSAPVGRPKGRPPDF